VLREIPDNRRELLDALEEYLCGSVENTEFHFQMRQFVAFYAIGRNLESYLHSLRELERSSISGSFQRAFAPNANPALSGTAINAPPLTGMLGIGASNLLRELYRIKRLKNPLGYPFAFTPIRKVRRLCGELFDIAEDPSPVASQVIFRKLKQIAERLGIDPTLEHCFDLPFQFLAEDSDLRFEVLDSNIEIASPEDANLDGAPEPYISS
jgi:hypothetical protein